MPGALDFAATILERTLPALTETPTEEEWLQGMWEERNRESWTAAIPNFVESVMGQTVGAGPEYYPERGFPDWLGTPLAESLKPAQSFPGIEADEVIKHQVGILLADAGVILQPKFLDMFKGVNVEVGLYGEGGGYNDPDIGVGALQAKQVGYPGPDYAVHTRRVGWTFLHEALHLLDYRLLRDSPVERKHIWEATLEHYDKTDPQSASWLRWTDEGENPVRGGAEAFNDALMHYLLYHENTWSSKLDKLLEDYFKFEATE